MNLRLTIPSHNKAECPNEAVTREFTGTCRICETVGHRASNCPNKPPEICRNCQQEGHVVLECKDPRKIDRSGLRDVEPADCWIMIKEAVADRDMEDVKDAVQIFLKAVPEITYAELEKAFRAQNIGIYLICVEKELQPTFTNSKLHHPRHSNFDLYVLGIKILPLQLPRFEYSNNIILVDLQGNLDKKYSVTWRWSDKAARPKEQDSWPTPEENRERLLDAGEPVDRGIVKCSNCDQLGHMKSKCPEEPNEVERTVVKCYNCDEIGHRVRDCKFSCPIHSP